MKIFDLPKEIRDLAIQEAISQYNLIGSDSHVDNTFTWNKTTDGDDFWNAINKGEFDIFYDTYSHDAAHIKLQKEFDQYKKESIKWSVEDFLHLDVEGYHITPENAQKALERMIEMHDAEVGINWEVVRFWFDEYATPNDEYYTMKGAQNFYKKGKDEVLFVGEGKDCNMIAIYEAGYDIPNYYEECTEAEFIAAYTKVKQLLNDIQI